MICYTGTEVLPVPRDTVVSVGKFDGLHLGHQALLSLMKKEAEAEGLSTLVLRVGAAQDDQKKLLTEQETRDRLSEYGIREDVRLALTGAFREMTHEEFAYRFIPEMLRAKAVVTGTDFRFGKGACGDARYLMKAGEDCGYKVLLVPDCTDVSEKVSSTLIRDLLSEGDVARANRCLGYPYTISGTVVHGRKLAGRLGYPTANIVPPAEKVLPRFGVYETEFSFSGRTYRGLANIGVKPTVSEEDKVLLEVHLLNFSGDLYGRTAEVRFLRFIRPERKFSGTDELKSRMELDIKCMS